MVAAHGDSGAALAWHTRLGQSREMVAYALRSRLADVQLSTDRAHRWYSIGIKFLDEHSGGLLP